MSLKSHSTSNSSTSSFVDAPDASDTLETVEVVDDRDTLKEEPLSTPNVSQIQSSATDKSIPHELDDQGEKKNVVTIFDVATEIETMLNDISLKIDENDKLVQEKIESIYRRLDKIESKVKPKN